MASGQPSPRAVHRGRSDTFLLSPVMAIREAGVEGSRSSPRRLRTLLIFYFVEDSRPRKMVWASDRQPLCI